MKALIKNILRKGGCTISLAPLDDYHVGDFYIFRRSAPGTYIIEYSCGFNSQYDSVDTVSFVDFVRTMRGAIEDPDLENIISPVPDFLG